MIMDGNKRWAKNNKISLKQGYQKGLNKLREIISICLKHKIKYLTVYALSTENLTSRSEQELDELFDLYVMGLDELVADKRIHDNGVRVSVIGRRELLPKKVIDSIDKAEKSTAKYENFVFTWNEFGYYELFL